MDIAASKEDVLTPAVITEILSANPQAAKSDTVMQILENRSTPLTEDQLATIEEGLFVIGAKESLETKLAGYRSAYNTSLKRIISHYKNDTLNPLAADSVIWFLNNENQLWARYSLTFEYLSEGDTSSAENTLNAIPNTFGLNAAGLDEHNQYLSYFNLLKQLKREGKSITEVDSSGTQILATLLNASHGVVSGYARNILTAKGEIVYCEPYIFPDGSLKSSNIRYKTSFEKQKSSRVKVYPNPARDYIIIEYSLDKEPENGSIELYEATGKAIKTIPINNTHDWLVVALPEIPAGNYLAILKTGMKPVGIVKFVIVK